jgi:hypothetical protein
VLQFPANALPRSLEDFLHDVRQAPGQALRMPIQLRWGGGLGSAVHAVQVIASWAQQADSGQSLRLPVAFAEQVNTRERFASTLPGMAALYFADSIQCEGASFSRFKALEVVAPRVAAMQSEAFRDTLRGQGAALCCFAGAKSEYLTPLYARPSPGHVREVSDFRVLLPRILRQLGDRAASSLNEGQLDYLSGLVYQLFLNADEHGSFDSNGDRYEHAMRGIVIRMTHVPDVVSLVRFAGDDTPLRAYLTKLALLPRSKMAGAVHDAKLPDGPMQLLEISVFDTGPGLALRWLANKVGRRSYNEVSAEEELEAVRTCFEKHATTKASQYFGQGLTMALAAMKRLNAFMTLRTGRLSLYQDFSRSDTVEFAPKNHFPGVRSLPEIAGTGYTICFRVK